MDVSNLIKTTEENGISYLTIMVNGKPAKIKLGKVRVNVTDINLENQTGLVSTERVLHAQTLDHSDQDMDEFTESEEDFDDSDDSQSDDPFGEEIK